MLATRWALLLRRLLLLLGLYFVLRLVFFFCNHRVVEDVGFWRIAQAFLYGLRFDLSALTAINLVFIVLSFLPRGLEPKPAYEWFLKAVFLALNIPFLVINVIDVEFFQFNGHRLTYQLLGLAGDPGVKWTTLVRTYWPLLLLGLFLIALLSLLYGKAAPRPIKEPPSGSPSPLKGERAGVRGEAVRLISASSKPLNIWLWMLNLALIFPLSILVFRGGLQWRPISPARAMDLNHPGLAQLALNSSFTVLKTFRNKVLLRHNYFAKRDDVLKLLRPLANGGESPLGDEHRRDNIVILVLESFSAEYWGAGNGGNRYTPFLDSLAGQSLFFPFNYANGRASIEAMPSILAGLPSLMSEPFINSAYQSDELLGLGAVLSREGYTTSFFHGGKNGTMHFDVFMHLAGMQHYFGLNQYPRRQQDYDGTWGIYDEPFLQFVATELSAQKPPFATAIFTLSSHHPYRIPEKYRGRFKKGTLPVHEVIGYTDYAVERFFETARQQPWFTNTLFIITADHTQKLETPEYANTLGQYRVPLLVFHPQRKFPDVNAARITQQVDILPSILDYLGIKPDRRLLFGKSIFRPGDGRAFLNVNGHYWLVRDQRAFEFIPEGPGGNLFDLAKDPQLKSPLLDDSDARRDLERESEALLQYFNNGLIDNNLYDRSADFPVRSNVK